MSMLYGSRGLVVVVMVLICSPGVRAQTPPTRSVTLADVLRRARENPPAVLVARAALARARAEHAVARAAYAPTANIEGSTGIEYANVPSFATVTVPSDATQAEREAATQVRVQRYSSTSLRSRGGASVDYALLDMARRPRVEAALQHADGQAEALSGSQRRALTTAAELYFGGLAAHALIADAQLSLARRTEQLQAVRTLVISGLRPTVDVTRAEVEVVAARYSVEARQIEARAALSALAVAIGDTPDQTLSPEPFDERSWPAPRDPRAASDLALAQRPEVRERELTLMARRAEQHAALAERLPTVHLSGTGNVSYNELLSGLGIDGAQSFAGGSLLVKWDALNLSVRRRTDVARANTDEAQHELARVVLTIRGEVYDADYQVQRTGVLLEQATEVLRGAQQALTAQNLRYRSGVASLLELLDAQSVEQTARRQRIEAERDHCIARVRLLAASGSIDLLER